MPRVPAEGIGVSDSPSLGFLVAFTAGVLSFLSPCVLPLVPSYIGFLTGLSLDEMGSRRRVAFTHALAFVVGFSPGLPAARRLRHGPRPGAQLPSGLARAPRRSADHLLRPGVPRGGQSSGAAGRTTPPSAEQAAWLSRLGDRRYGVRGGMDPLHRTDPGRHLHPCFGLGYGGTRHGPARMPTRRGSRCRF